MLPCEASYDMHCFCILGCWHCETVCRSGNIFMSFHFTMLMLWQLLPLHGLAASTICRGSEPCE